MAKVSKESVKKEEKRREKEEKTGSEWKEKRCSDYVSIVYIYIMCSRMRYSCVPSCKPQQTVEARERRK